MIPFTSLDAVTSTGPGVAKDLEGSVERHYLLVFTTGAPSEVGVRLEGSHDGIHWSSFGAQANSSLFIEFGLRYVRANLSTLTGGTSPTVTASIASL